MGPNLGLSVGLSSDSGGDGRNRCSLRDGRPAERGRHGRSGCSLNSGRPASRGGDSRVHFTHRGADGGIDLDERLGKRSRSGDGLGCGGTGGCAKLDVHRRGERRHRVADGGGN